MVSLEIWLILCLITTTAYIIFGLTGFGSAIVATPLFACFFPLSFVVPLILILEVACTLLMGLKNRGHINRAELLRFLPFILAGMLLGATLLVKVAESVLLFSLGCFILAYVVWSFFFRHRPVLLSPVWRAPLGAAGGVFSALFGTGGPLYVIYLSGRIHDKDMLRGTLAAMLLISSAIRLMLFTANGLYHQQSLLLAASLLPCALLGTFLGHLLHTRLPVHRVLQGILIMLALSGLNLILRSMSA